ncbi:MAG: hypothetical protein ACXVHT_04900 [Methanobacterium sp.]
MDKIINLEKFEPLSDSDMKKLTKNQANIISYGDLSKYKSIDDYNLLGKSGCLIILYETKENYGHWVCLFRDPNDKSGKTVEFFDSYAIPMDYELKLIPEYYRKNSEQDFPHLSYLLSESKYTTIRINDVQLQNDKTSVSTCGRWVCVRILLRAIPLKDFIKLFTDQKFDPDWYITAISMLSLA